jgi:hypothetical protein
VYENVITVISADESITLLFIEPLYFSFCHVLKLL